MKNRKVSLYIAMSLDGYIATEDDSLDWLFKTKVDGDAGYEAFYKPVDTVVMGNRTYEWILNEMKGTFPYENKKCFVFTSKEKQHSPYVQFVHEDVKTFTRNLKEENGGTIWLVGGGGIIHSFLQNNLIDEYIITIAPVLIGKGIPLFQPFDQEIDLELKEVRQYGQFAQLIYARKSS